MELLYVYYIYVVAILYVCNYRGPVQLQIPHCFIKVTEFIS